MANTEQELRDIFGQMRTHFRVGRLTEETSFYFTLGDGPAEKWTVKVGPERCEVGEGKLVDQADCVVKTSPELFLKMVKGQYTPGAMDFMRGKIKSNDPLKLKVLQEAFDL